MKIRICSETEARKLSYHPSMKEAVIVSICDRDREPVRFNPAGPKQIHRFRFEDVLDSRGTWGMPPTEDDFSRLADFCRNGLSAEPRELIVHCHAGISRSSAVAFAFAAKQHGLEWAKEHFQSYLGWICPNRLIAAELDARLGFDGQLLALCEFYVDECLKQHMEDESV